MHDISRLNATLYSKSMTLCQEIQDLYTSLSKKVFSLADNFNKISNHFKQLEKLKEIEMGKMDQKISESYNFFKITLYAWSNHYKMNGDAILKLIKPYCKTNLSEIKQIKDVRNLPNSLDVRPKRRVGAQTHEGVQEIGSGRYY